MTAIDPIQWLLQGVEPDKRDLIRAAWSGKPGVAKLPVGLGWDVVRVTQKCGMDVIEALESANRPLGPMVFSARSWSVEFLVPVGTADTWRAPMSAASGRRGGGFLWCPQPGRTRWQRTWLRIPNGVLTQPDDLHRALERIEIHNYGLPESAHAHAH